MTSPALALKRWIPELGDVDDRMWLMLLGLVGLAGFFLKKWAPPLPLVILGLIVLVVVWRGRGSEFPLYALIAYLPFSRSLAENLGLGISFLNLMNVLTLWVLAAYVIRQFRQKQPLLEMTPLHGLILIFAALSLFALIRAGWMYGGWYFWGQMSAMKRWLMPFVFFGLTFAVVKDERTAKTVLLLVLIAVTVVALMAIWEYWDRAGSTIERARVRGITANPNQLGAFFIYYMFLFMALFLTYPKRLFGWLLLVGFLICGRGMMATFSRGAYAAFAAGMLATCGVRNKWLFVVATAIGIFALANPSLLPQGVRYRMNMTVTKGHSISVEEDLAQELEHNLEPSAARRVVIWEGAQRMIQDHPFWGVGYGAFPTFLPHYVEPRALGQQLYVDAHNTFFMVATEMGLPTLAIFLSVLAVVGYYAWWLWRRGQDRTLRAMGLGLVGGLAGLVVSNLFSSCMNAEEVVGYFWILCGLAMRAIVLQRRTRST